VLNFSVVPTLLIYGSHYTLVFPRYLTAGEILQNDGNLDAFIVEIRTELCYPFHGIVFMVQLFPVLC